MSFDSFFKKTFFSLLSCNNGTIDLELHANSLVLTYCQEGDVLQPSECQLCILRQPKHTQPFCTQNWKQHGKYKVAIDQSNDGGTASSSTIPKQQTLDTNGTQRIMAVEKQHMLFPIFCQSWSHLGMGYELHIAPWSDEQQPAKT